MDCNPDAATPEERARCLKSMQEMGFKQAIGYSIIVGLPVGDGITVKWVKLVWTEDDSRLASELV